MEFVHCIYHQFFFTANGSGSQPTTSQFFQPLALQTVALAPTPIHCMLSICPSGINSMMMFSQDIYQGKFHPTLVIYVNLEPTALNYSQYWATTLYLLPSKTTLGYALPKSLSTLQGHVLPSSMSFQSQFLLFWCPSAGMSTRQSQLVLLSIILHF